MLSSEFTPIVASGVFTTLVGHWARKTCMRRQTDAIFTKEYLLLPNSIPMMIRAMWRHVELEASRGGI
jgi:hypothetical protein